MQHGIAPISIASVKNQKERLSGGISPAAFCLGRIGCAILPNIMKIRVQRSILVKKEPTEKLLPATPDNAKHKSRQVKKKNGDTSKDNASGKNGV